MASLSLNKDLLARIIPDDQSFKDGEYQGIFHFQFWQVDIHFVHYNPIQPKIAPNETQPPDRILTIDESIGTIQV